GCAVYPDDGPTSIAACQAAVHRPAGPREVLTRPCCPCSMRCGAAASVECGQQGPRGPKPAAPQAPPKNTARPTVEVGRAVPAERAGVLARAGATCAARPGP